VKYFLWTYNISVIKLNPPYDLMVDLRKIVSGRPLRTRLELYAPYIRVNTYQSFNKELEALLQIREKPRTLERLIL
jgi:hypothetical protein